MAEQLAEDRNTLILSEEYKLWKKNVPFMYDYMFTRATEYFSPTVQWLPQVEDLDPEMSTSHDAAYHRLLLGTNAHPDENFIYILPVIIPNGGDKTEDEPKTDLYHFKEDELGTFCGFNDKMNVEMKLSHQGEVQCARYMPSNPNIIATKNEWDELFIYDLSNVTRSQNYEESGIEPFDPTFEYTIDFSKGCRSNYSNVCWNPEKEGILLSCYNSSKSIALWNIDMKIMERQLVPKHVFTDPHLANSSTDIYLKWTSWNNYHSSIFASCSSDGHAFIWDYRCNGAKASHRVHAHTKHVNCLEFATLSEFVFATTSLDQTVGLWDLRNLSMKVYSITNNKQDEYTRLNWSPHVASMLGVATNDRRLYIYDLDKVFDEQTQEEADEGPSTLSFIHHGQTLKIYDFDWNSNEPLMMCSVSEDNVLQIWKMIRHK